MGSGIPLTSLCEWQHLASRHPMTLGAWRDTKRQP